MCFVYQCFHCKKARTEICELWTEKDKCGNMVREYPWGHKKMWCPTCFTVVGAINALNALVFREPWLLTEGMAGAPVLEDWEREGLEEPAVAEDSGSEGDGFTKKQREEVRWEAEAAFNARFEALKVVDAEKKEGEEEEEKKEKEAK